MHIPFAPTIEYTRKGLRSWYVIAAFGAMLALTVAAVIGGFQIASRATTADAVSVGPAAAPHAPNLASRAFQPNSDYRVYLVGSQEQADSLRAVLSELENPTTGEQSLHWRYEVVVLESAASERELEQNIADLNNDRLVFGLPEIWVVDHRSR